MARRRDAGAGLEPDTEAAICYPPHPAFDRLCEIFIVAFSRNGATRTSAAGWLSSTGRLDSRT
jgi:hypothetical protein